MPRLGDKAFEQAAGFLRIRDAKNPLDSSAVHPERYATVEKMAKDMGQSVKDLIRDENLRKIINLNRYVDKNTGLPTLQDIMEELAKPGRDPRQSFEVFSFMEGINQIEDLKVGMKLPGIVTNITNFGAFVDIGVHQDGLVHVSHLSDKFITNPAEVVSVQQSVEVTIVEVDVARKRISLSMKAEPFAETITDKTNRPGKVDKESKVDKQKQGKNNNFKPSGQKLNPKEKAKKDEADMQAKLAMLKGKFR